MVDFYSEWLSFWGGLTLIAVISFFFISVIHYMALTIFTTDPRRKRIVMAEMIDALAVGLMVIFFLSTADAVVRTFGFHGLIGEMIFITGEAIKSSKTVASLSVALAKVWGIPYTYFISTWGITINAGAFIPVVYRKIAQAYFFMQKATELQVFLYGQKAVLEMIAKYSLPIFIPLGIILRSIPLTRGMGGLFLSMGIALYFIYPGVLLLTYQQAPILEYKLPPSRICNFPVSLPVLSSYSPATFVSFSSPLPSVDEESIKDFLLSMYYRFFFGQIIALSISFIFLRFATVMLGGMPTAFVSLAMRFL